MKRVKRFNTVATSLEGKKKKMERTKRKKCWKLKLMMESSILIATEIFAGSGEFVSGGPEARRTGSRSGVENPNDPSSRNEWAIRTRDTSRFEGSVPFLIFFFPPAWGTPAVTIRSLAEIFSTKDSSLLFQRAATCYQPMQFVNFWWTSLQRWIKPIAGGEKWSMNT